MPTHKVYLFRNGNTAVFDPQGQQVPKAQEAWILLVARHLESIGIRPESCEWLLPDGSPATLFKIGDGGYNWSL